MEVLFKVDFKTFCIKTLGCKINQYETQAITEALIKKGKILADPSQADLIIFNSCAVTQKAVVDLKKQVNQIQKNKKKTSKIILTGCAAQVLKDKLATWKYVDTIIPGQEKFKYFIKSNSDSFPPISNYFRARAILKIQDGCSHRCTYCIVPLARGKSRSREPKAILEELNQLAEAGFKEIILSGINLRQYGRDLSPNLDFWDLLTFLDKHFDFTQQQIRIRISSLEPKDLNSKALEVLAKKPFICPHLHISLQSGSNKILKAMGRGHYQVEDLVNFIEKLKSIWPLFGLGMDILVGFPGESEADFQETYNLIKELPLTYAHVFPYSPRPNTPAATFPNQVNKEVKKLRAQKLRELAQEKQLLFLKKLKNLPYLEVIVENAHSGTSQYYQQVFFSAPPNKKIKETQKVKPWQIQDNKLFGLPL